MDNTKYHTIPLDDDRQEEPVYDSSLGATAAENPPVQPTMSVNQMGIPPPAYEALEGTVYPASDGATASSSAGISSELLTPSHQANKCESPPPYSVALADLPTYEEAQRNKIVPPVVDDDEDSQREDGPNLFARDNDILGTDFMFFISFFVAFLFNWVGFLLLLCFCHTLAARYGALAGFGLSLAKWTLLVKHSTDLVSSENEWLWWIIMAFGVLICARASLQYVHAKREWRLLNNPNPDRLVFLY